MHKTVCCTFHIKQSKDLVRRGSMCLVYHVYPEHPQKAARLRQNNILNVLVFLELCKILPGTWGDSILPGSETIATYYSTRLFWPYRTGWLDPKSCNKTCCSGPVPTELKQALPIMSRERAKSGRRFLHMLPCSDWPKLVESLQRVVPSTAGFESLLLVDI